jgi:3',5'-nucleoside bisphosphate phosphatase
MKNRFVISMLFIALLSNLLPAQIVPNIGDYKTLKCDFHMHTVFSDGEVWPSIRIDEAIDEGLDVIAITDHLEYLPHKKYVSTDMNASYNIAKNKAARKGLILIRGAEFTRWMPPGHLNALFIEDANKLLIDDFLPAIEEAISQGAFIFWNHPGWIAHQPDKVVRWYDIHQTLVDRGWMHGIEFANYHEYYTGALEYTNKFDLAVLGNSDVHGMVHSEFLQDHQHRTLTLIFATDKKEEAVKEALFAGRSLALSDNDVLAGPKELMTKFVEACLHVDISDENITLSNLSEIPFNLERPGLGEFKLEALGEIILPEAGSWEIKNTYIDKNEHLTLELGQ